MIINIENLPIVDNILFSKINNSSIHGYGLFATRDIPARTILGFLDGQLVPFIDEFSKPFEWNCINKNTLLIRPIRTKYGYINHSRTPNLLIKKHPMHIITINDIIKNEEFTLDYRDEPLPQSYIKSHGATYL